MADLPGGNVGSFVPTNFIWDVSRLSEVDVNSAEFKELLVRLYQNLNVMAIVINTKHSGIYYPEEFVNGKIFFPNPALNSSTAEAPAPRQNFRTLVLPGALPNTGTLSVPHGISVSASTSSTLVIGSATNPSTMSMLPLPYASPTLANNIELNADATNVNITTGSNRSGYTITYVILEYLQS